MGLLKVPLILLSAFCVHVTFTSPSRTETNKSRDDNDVQADWRARFGWTWYEDSPLRIANTAAALRVLMQLPNVLELVSLLLGGKHASESLTISPTYLSGLTLMTLGSLLRMYAYRSLGAAYTFNFTLDEGHALVTHGAYAVVRHPGYASGYLVIAGAVLSQLGAVSCGGGIASLCRWFGAAYVALAVWMVVATVQRADAEDEVLREVYEEKWEEWARRTPEKFVPWVC